MQMRLLLMSQQTSVFVNFTVTLLSGNNKEEILIRFGTRQCFELMVKTKVDTINDNVVTTGRTISQQSPCAIHSASIAWIVRQEIDKKPLSQ